jgi:hypothetical protein
LLGQALLEQALLEQDLPASQLSCQLAV